jgi:hypothetical protein
MEKPYVDTLGSFGGTAVKGFNLTLIRFGERSCRQCMVCKLTLMEGMVYN